jgi:hypothetical protein
MTRAWRSAMTGLFIHVLGKEVLDAIRLELKAHSQFCGHF